jgi:hypothetical protein
LNMLDNLLGFALAVAAYLALMLLVAIGRIGWQRLARRRMARRNRRPPEWWMTLLVRVDDESAVIRPAVQIRGDPLPKSVRVHLEVVDFTDRKRYAATLPFPPSALDSEFALPPFSLGDGMFVEPVLHWRWNVVLTKGRRELARWNQRLISFENLNAEAEIDSVRL